MITVGMNYEIIEGKEKEFETMFAKVLTVMADFSGHSDTHLFTDVWKSNSYLVISEWSDEKAFDGFISSERFKNVVDWGKEKVLASRPKHEVYGRGATRDEACPASAAAK